MHQTRFLLGLRPRPRWEAITALPQIPWQRLLLGEGGNGEGKGRIRKGKGEGMGEEVEGDLVHPKFFSWPPYAIRLYTVPNEMIRPI